MKDITVSFSPEEFFSFPSKIIANRTITAEMTINKILKSLI